MEVNHKISMFHWEKNKHKAWLFSDSVLTVAEMYDLATELRGWSLDRMKETEEAEKKSEEEKVEEDKACCKEQPKEE